jgi:hypothetical protein
MGRRSKHKKLNGRNAMRTMVFMTSSTAYLQRTVASPHWKLTLWDYIVFMGEIARREKAARSSL